MHFFRVNQPIALNLGGIFLCLCIILQGLGQREATSPQRVHDEFLAIACRRGFLVALCQLFQLFGRCQEFPFLVMHGNAQRIEDGIGLFCRLPRTAQRLIHTHDCRASRINIATGKGHDFLECACLSRGRPQPALELIETFASFYRCRNQRCQAKATRCYCSKFREGAQQRLDLSRGIGQSALHCIQRRHITKRLTNLLLGIPQSLGKA